MRRLPLFDSLKAHAHFLRPQKQKAAESREDAGRLRRSKICSLDFQRELNCGGIPPMLLGAIGEGIP